jgi:TRAP-type C4-dicarboxylate transport system permease small subunit
LGKARDINNGLNRLHARYEQVSALLGATLMAAIVIITVTQVYYRYFLSDSLVWAEEACRSLLIWICFLFAGIAFQRGEMVAVNFVTAALPRHLRAAVIAIGYTATAAFLCSMVYYGWSYASQNWIQTVPGLELLLQSLTGGDARFSIFWVYLAVPVGSAILLLHVLVSGARILATAFRPSSTAEA